MNRVTPLSRTFFTSWIERNGVRLKRKEKLLVPRAVGHLQHCGFKRWTYAAEPSQGKVRDWVYQFPLGQGRLHAWEMADESFIMHWDEYDPARSFPEMFNHCWHESPMARSVFIVGAIFLGVSALSSLEQVRHR